MTSIVETRTDASGNAYTVLTPLGLADDPTYLAWFCEQLRDFLFRQGINVAHLPDEQICFQVRNTFANTNSRRGPISSAKPVESGHNPTTGKDGQQ